jgi:hypothetical protein
MFSPDGDVVGSRPMTAQLYYLIWFFWPRLAVKKHLTAQQVQQFLIEETGLHFGKKLVETACTDVELTSRASAESIDAT